MLQSLGSQNRHVHTSGDFNVNTTGLVANGINDSQQYCKSMLKYAGIIFDTMGGVAMHPACEMSYNLQFKLYQPSTKTIFLTPHLSRKKCLFFLNLPHSFKIYFPISRKNSLNPHHPKN